MTSVDLFKLVIVGLVGYLLGSANSSLIVGKFYGVDIRKHGSGNAGATNTLRTLGKKAAVFTLAGDFLKGIIACVIGRLIAGDTGLMLGGVAAVIGHNWPVYFGFKGGKGVLTSLAAVLMMDPLISLIALAIFILVVAITRYVSLGSILAAALFPIMAYLFGRGAELAIFSGILALLIIFRHRSNIGRIIKGSESKFGSKKA